MVARMVDVDFVEREVVKKANGIDVYNFANLVVGTVELIVLVIFELVIVCVVKLAVVGILDYFDWYH